MNSTLSKNWLIDIVQAKGYTCLVGGRADRIGSVFLAAQEKCAFTISSNKYIPLHTDIGVHRYLQWTMLFAKTIESN